jgi:hypothetical protein
MTHEPCSIAFFLHSPSRGGAQIIFLRLAKAMAEAGHRVAIVCQVGADHEVAERSPLVEYHFLDAPKVRQSIVPLARFCREWQADVLISALLHNNLCAILSKFLAFGATKVVVTEHAPIAQLIESNGWNKWLLCAAIRVLYTYADAVVAVSQGVLDEVRQLAPNMQLSRLVYNPIIDDDRLERCGRPVATTRSVRHFVPLLALAECP